MRSKCDTCGVENDFISNMKSRKCSACKEPMDWRLKVKCSDCGITNHINRTEARTALCNNCYNPISSSATPEDYAPNKVPLRERLASLLISGLLIGMSTYAIIYKHIEIPIGGGRRRHGSLYEFSGYEITLPVISFVFAMVGFLASFIDHYDKRQNEHIYKSVRRFCLAIAFTLYTASIFVGHKIA